MARLPSLTTGPPEVRLNGEPIPGVESIEMHRSPIAGETEINIRTKERHMSQFSTRVHLDMPASGSSEPKGDRPEVRQTLANLIESGLRDHFVPEIDDVLVLDDEPDNDGPLGGRSSSVLAYVTLAGESEPVAVAINVYADDKIAAKAEARLDEIEAQTKLQDRIERARALLGGGA